MALLHGTDAILAERVFEVDDDLRVALGVFREHAGQEPAVGRRVGAQAQMACRSGLAVVDGLCKLFKTRDHLDRMSMQGLAVSGGRDPTLTALQERDAAMLLQFRDPLAGRRE